MGETKRRGIIKNIIIIFLVIMLVLTLFSNTIMNRSLPEVSVSNSQGGSITSQIKLNGSVSANQTKVIKLDKARTVDTVIVRRGDTVVRGDLLATLVKGESNDIYNLETELKRLEIEYKQMLIKEGDSLVSQRRIIEDSKKELEAIDTYLAGYAALDAKVKGYEAEIQVVKGDIEELEAEIEKLEDSKKYVLKKQKDYSSGGYDSLKALNAAIEAKEKEIELLENEYSAAKTSRTAALNARDAAKNALSAYDKKNSEKTSLEGEISTLKTSVSEKESAISAKEREYDELDATLNAENEAEVTARLSELRAEINSLKAEKNTLNATLAEKKSELASVKEELGKMSPRTELEEAVAAANSNYTDKNNACELAKFNLNTKKKELDSFSDSGFEFFLLQAYIDDYADKIEEATELKEDFEKQLSKAEMIIKEVQSEITKTPEECENDKLKLTRTIEDAEEAIRIAEANGAIKNETAAMNLEIKKREIERKKKEIQDLKNATAETEIKAPVSGTISSVGIASGSDVDADTVAFEIIMTDMGYTMECSVTNSQAARLRIGQEATVQYYYWGNKPSVRISQITTDPNSGGKNKLVTFAVEGDVSAGTSLSLVIGTEGQSYDTIVPNSAIREDSNGKFVLKVVSKSSPLGNRYFAERLDVEVLASDATKSAINASLSWGDYVIVGASVPISAGMQVRMAE